jgi:hypothetical protein
MKNVFLLGLSALVSGNALSQTEELAVTDTVVMKKLEMSIGLGAGVVRFMGDVQDASEKVNVHFMGNRAAYDLGVGFGFSRSFTMNINLIYGKLSGNENTFGEHRNFESQQFQGGVNVEYNFAGLYRNKLPVLNPFILGGVYYSNYFNISTDLMNNDGVEYQYWSDGRIRDLAEDSPNAEAARNISRDYDYETSLVRKSVHTGSLSAGFGVDLHLSRAFTARFMSRYFHSFSDNLDGADGGSFAENDGFFFSTISLIISPMAFRRDRRDVPSIYNSLVNFKQVEEEDMDGDGVRDMDDRCAATLSGVKVDKWGCPLDEDVDGIPNYRDESPGTEKNVIVDTKGSPIDYELVEERWSVSADVYGVTWQRKYPNPQVNRNAGYTLNVGAGERGSKETMNPVILRIPELRENVINDSLVVYSLGVYQSFQDATNKRFELEKQGVYASYVVLESVSKEVGKDLSVIDVQAPEPIPTLYAIKESIEKIRAIERTFPTQLDYSLSQFERYLYNGVPESVLAKPFLKAILPFTYDPKVMELYTVIQEKLKESPVAVLPQYYEETAATTDAVTPVSEEVTVTNSVVVGSDTLPSGTERTNETFEQAIARFKALPVSGRQPKINYAPVKDEFESADLDKDQLISAAEIQLVLEDIVNGKSDFTTEKFNAMTVYFTEFTQNVETIDFGGAKAVHVNGVLTILKAGGGAIKEESRRLLAMKYKEADLNKDGDLTPQEVQETVERYLKGDSSYAQVRVHELINLYFN